MDNENKKPEGLKKTIQKKQGEILEGMAKNYAQTTEQGKQFGKDSLEKINKVTATGAEFLKSQQYWKSIKNQSYKIKEKSLEQTALLKKQSPKFYKKISNAFFNFFELLVGRIKLGTQYGVSSLETLEKLAKLKELGIITDNEFAQKKKKILDRI